MAELVEDELIWEDISTAPKDGSRVWLRRFAEGKIRVEGWAVWDVSILEKPNHIFSRWMDENRWIKFPNPTQWCPSKTREGSIMIQDHTAYPNITKLTLNMVGYNGGLNRHRTPEIGAEADVMRLLDEILGAEGIYHKDLEALDTWLGALDEDQLMTVADGEDTARELILKDAPLMGDMEGSVDAFIENIWEHCV